MSDWNDQVLTRLRENPAAAPILGALEGEEDVWIVGGAVRDVLLGREFGELDFVVEGEAAPVAQRAAERLGGTVVEHERFATATVSSPAGVFDLTSARTETYPAPGALPEVLLGATIAEDLARRDFTVNAIAVRLEDAAGAAWPRAFDDLQAGVLHVLHARSFVEDPTRILRLARYAARLGFEPDEETARAAADAVSSGAMARASGSRVGEELRMLLREPQPTAVQRLSGGLGATIVHPLFRIRTELLTDALELAPPEALAPAIVLASCLLETPPGELAVRLEDLAFPAGERDAVLIAANRAAGVAEELASAGSDSSLHFQLRNEALETVALAGALAGDDGRERVVRWLSEIRAARLEISGHDLLEAGLSGPAVGQALDAALAAAIDGKASDRDSQLAAALAAQ